MNTLDQILNAIAHADQSDRLLESIDEFEDEFVAVLTLIKANQELRPKIVDVFCMMLRDESHGHYTLIEFCMHELRWEEFLQEAERIYTECNEEVVRGKHFGGPLQYVMALREVISSFSDTWENKDLFKYYCDK